jgi:branched-subunit amino acid transport protein
LTLWWILLAAGLVTFAIRISFLADAGRFDPSPLLRRALRFVPVAVLTALIVPDLLLQEGAIAFSLDNHRLLAGIVAVLTAWRTGNTLLTIGAGMVALLGLQALLG